MAVETPYRYCVYCHADCWPAPVDQRHAETCPTVTGVYPATGESCCACGRPVGDAYGLVDDATGCPVTCAAEGSTSWVVCLGCLVLARDPRPATLED